MYNQNASQYRLQSKIYSSKLFRQPYQTQYQQKNKEKSIQQFLHSQNNIKVQSFKQSLQMMADLHTMQFQDNSTYYGQVIQDCIRQGIGIFQTQQGDIYLGDWNNDTYHGYGMYIYHDGQRYEGELVEGLKQGEGKYFYKDGRIYQGHWRDDQRQGQGIQRDIKKGIYYHGQWVNDQKQGPGKLCLLNPMDWGFRFSQVAIMQGVWSNNKFCSGVVQTQSYKGEFRNQTITGQGLYKFPDGSMYQGQFLNNLMNGIGTYYHKNGNVYEGNFICGLKNGKGIYKYFTGDIYTGSYDKDVKSGQGKFLFVNGNYYVGQFERDCFHGKGKYFFSKDQFICGWWQNGQLTKNDKNQQIGMNRKIILMKQNLSAQRGNQTPRNNNRSRSPINFATSTPQMQNIRSISPFNSGLSKHTNNFVRQEKASMIPINPTKSPIKNSKFMQVHTPNDNYLKSGSYNYSSNNPNIQVKNLISEDKTNKFIKQESQTNQNYMYDQRQLIGNSNKLNRDQKIYEQKSQNLERKSNNKQRQSDRSRGYVDNNLFELMNGGEQGQIKENKKGVREVMSDNKGMRKVNENRNVKKISKKFER